jgi:hypothetical protein
MQKTRHCLDLLLQKTKGNFIILHLALVFVRSLTVALGQMEQYRSTAVVNS